MPLRGVNFSENNNNENLICINVDNKIKYLPLMDAVEMAKSIITQIQIIGLQNVGQTGSIKDKKDITRKTGGGT